MELQGAATMSGRSTGIPIYLRIADVLRSKIQRKTLKPGSPLSTLEDLQREFAVGRNTVRLALKVLANEGLIAMGSGRSTLVLPVQPSARDALRPKPVGSLPARALTIRRLGLQRNSALPMALGEGVSAHERYVRMEKLHLLHGKPFSVVEIFVIEEIFEKIPRSELSRDLFANLVRRNTNFDSKRGDQTLDAVPADGRVATVLHVELATPVIRIMMRAFDDEGRVAIAALHHCRADLFRLHEKLPRPLEHPEQIWRANTTRQER
jgi:GntR family transcriptional regulator